MCRSWSGIDLIFINAQWCILPWGASNSKATAWHAWNLWRVLYLPAIQCSCSPSPWDNQPSEARHLHAFILPDLLPPISTDLNPIDYKNMGEMGLSSSWCRWTEAAVDWCLASFQAKRHRWRSWWVAQVSLQVNLCERNTFRAFNLTPTRNTFCGTWYLPHSHVHN